ncbi:MAG TPA: glutamine amidotransferase [Gemmataceae bacterium]|jgi:uncharacterized membrane protein|nr:glutamine amidotransferase [Gemmataceae bacterium]
MTVHEWSPLYGAWTYIGLGLALIALLLLARIAARSPTARRWPLLLLRIGLLALLIVILLNPTRVTETRLPPRTLEVIYLVDCSRSMALDRPVSRLDQVKQVIRPGQPSRSANPPPVHLYRFGDHLESSSGIDNLLPTDDDTRLLEALERLPDHFVDGLPGAVVIFSDGRATETAGFDEVAAGYRRLHVPIHVFPVGERVAGDVAIQDVIAPREAPPGTRLPVRVVVRSRGYQGQRTVLHVRSLSDPARSPLATLPITLTGGTQAHELLIDHDASAGRLVAEVAPLDGELLLENNRVPFQISARKAKVHVLYMEGTLNNEYHWVRDALVEDPAIECLAIEVNNQYAAQPTLHRVNDPERGYPTTRQELFGYDVVICSDISRAAFTDDQLAWTVELVHKRGGGFAMVGGNTSFGAGNWDKTVWDGLIPVDMGGQAEAPGRGTCWGVQFRVKVPRKAERHPIWRLVDDPVQNRRILDRMPPFTGTNLVERLKPAATALAYSDQPLPQVGVMPVFSCEPFGKGRTFAMSTDTTDDWGHFFERDWGEAGDNRYFRKFWRNVVLWLAENAAGANRRLRVETDKLIYRPGQPIRVTARAYDDKLEETRRYRLVSRLRPATAPPTRPDSAALGLQEFVLSPQAADQGYAGQTRTPPLRQVPPTSSNPLASLRLLALDVAAYDGDRRVSQTTLDVQVLDDPSELQDPQPDPARLAAIARASGGKVLHSAADLHQVLDTLTRTPGAVVVDKSPLWDCTALWLLLVALLAAEWSLRRWWGLA